MPSVDGGYSFREIVRQRWNFSLPNSVREVEEYRVDLSGSLLLNWSLCPTSAEEWLASR
jgi:hypothetical protein